MGNEIILEKWGLEDNSSAWDGFIENSANCNMYQKNDYLKIYSYKCKYVEKLVFRKKNSIIAAVPIGVHDDLSVFSPFSASFGGINHIEPISLEDMLSMVELLIDHCKKNGYQSIEICQPPIIYYDNFDEKIEYALKRNGFVVREYDLCFYKSAVNWEEILDMVVLRNVKKACNNGLIFNEIQNPQECFEFISYQKKREGIVFSINLPQFCMLKEKFGESVKTFGVFMEQRLIASIIIYVINKRCVLGFNWASDKDFQEYRPSDFMLYNAMKWAFSNGHKYFDFGTTTLNSIPHWGVTRFKEKFNPLSVLRKKFIRSLV